METLPLKSDSAVATTTRRAGEKGTAIVESAIVLGLVLVTLFAIIEGSRMLWFYNSIGYGSRVGSRYAMVRGSGSASPVDATAVSDFVKSKMVGLNSSATTVTTTWSPDNKPGSIVTVQVQYHYTLIMPL